MIKHHRLATLQLADLDAAIVLKADGTLEASLPQIDTDTVPENVLTGAALIYALNTPEICQLIYKNFAEKCVGTTH